MHDDDDDDDDEFAIYLCVDAATAAAAKGIPTKFSVAYNQFWCSC